MPTSNTPDPKNGSETTNQQSEIYNVEWMKTNLWNAR